MRNSRAYQLVSEHSILSAQRKNTVAAMKVKDEEPAPAELEESDSLNWFKNEALPGFAGEDPIGWISKAERFFEEKKICSSHKTQWAFMRMEGVAQNWFFSWCQEELDAEWESFAVDLIKRFKEPESKKSEERRGTPESEKEDGWNENSENGWKFQKFDVIVNHEDQKKEDEPQKYQNGGEAPTSYCAITTTETMHFHNTTKECNLDAGKKETRPEGVEMDGGEQESSDETTTEGSLEDLLTEEQPPEPPEPPDGGVFKGGGSLGVVKREGGDKESSTTAMGNEATATKASRIHNLEKSSLFFVGEMCDSEREEKQSGSDGNTAVTAPEEENDDAAVEEEWLARDEGVQLLSQSVEGCNESGEEKQASVGWSSKLLDLKFESLGQAQHLIFTPSQFTNNRGVFQEKGKWTRRTVGGLKEFQRRCTLFLT